MSFKKSIIILLILFATIPIILVSAVTLSISIKDVESSKLNHLNSLAVSNGSALNELINSQKREVELMSSRMTLITYLKNAKDKNAPFDVSDIVKSALNLFLKEWIESEISYDDVLVCNNLGFIVTGYNQDKIWENVNSEVFFSEAIKSNKIYISNVTSSTFTGWRNNILMSHVINNENNEKIGVIVLFISVNFFDNFIKNISFDKTGLAFIVDSNGLVIYHPYMKYLGVNISPNVEEGGFFKNLATKSGQFITSIDNEKRTMSYYLLDELPWAFVIRQMQSEILESRYSILTLNIAAILVSLLISIFASLIITKRFTKPLTILNNAFSKGAKENKYELCNVDSNNEFEELANNYNNMIEKLNKNLYQLNKSHEENIYIATHDPVTGLLNRIGIEKKIKDLIKDEIPFQIHYIDIDNFKMINEIYGHSFGDKLLKKFANTISEINPSLNTCARVGGDEFFIISMLKDNDGNKIADNIKLVFLKEYIINNIEINITGSIGITLFPNDDGEFETVIRNLDLALFKAKSSGKNKYCFFNDNMRKEMERENQIKEVLNYCIEKREIILMLQPEIETSTKQILAFESLMRIKSQCLGNIGPSEFIPIAESNGLILKIGWWILEKACIFTKKIIECNASFKCTSVNISTLQLMEKDFVDKVLFIIHMADIDPKYIQLEITETTLMNQLDINIEKLKKLRNRGITIALDDFGTSYSSLNYLINLPIDVIKIDKSFIDEICETKKKQLVTETIINLSHNLGLKVVAEGIENIEQFHMLKEQKCDLIQGYYFSKPIPEEEAFEMVKIDN